ERVDSKGIEHCVRMSQWRPANQSDRWSVIRELLRKAFDASGLYAGPFRNLSGGIFLDTYRIRLAAIRFQNHVRQAQCQNAFGSGIHRYPLVCVRAGLRHARFHLDKLASLSAL